MGKTLKYVKDFDFNAKPCNYSSGGSAKKYAVGGDVKADVRGAIERSIAAGDRNFAQKLGDLRTVNLGGNSSLTIGGGLRKPTITYTKRFKEGGEVKMASGGYYKKGGACGDVKMASGGYYSKGGKATAGDKKMSKVMGEFKAGELHSGSKKGPAVTSKKQAVAIAMSEARKASKKG